MRRRGLLAALAVPALAPPARALAQPAWPSRPIRMLIPFPPGGTTDILGRYLAPPLSAALGQNVVVENRTGGNGAVAIVEMVRAAPDGHTLCMSISTLITQALLTKQPYHPINDVTPILHLANVGNIVVVNPALPVHSLAELVAYAKANPGRLSYGSPGIGSSVHLSGELFSQAAGIQMVHVPYRGGGPALADLVAGNIQLMFGNASSTLPFVRGGSVRPLAVTSATRQVYAPDLPTIAEAGYPGFAVVEWYAMIGPAGIPAAVVERINREIMAIVGTSDGRARLLDLGAEVVGGTPAEFAAFLRQDLTRTEALIRGANIKAE